MTLNVEPLASTMRCANPPTTFSRSSSTSTKQSSSSGNLSTRARKPLTNSGVYVEPPPITATLSILFFNARNYNSLYEEALGDSEEDQWENDRHQRAGLGQLGSLSIYSVEC